MVAPGAFPLIKLGAMAVRQIAKPLANIIKNRARASPFFRDYVCMPPAQLYHWMDVNVKMRMLNLGKPREVRKLDQNAAIDLGADLLGEIVVYGVGVITVVSEYVRQSNNSAIAKAELEAKWNDIESRIAALEAQASNKSGGLKKWLVSPKNESKPIVPESNASSSSSSSQQPNTSTSSSSATLPPASPAIKQGAISKALEDATGKLSSRKPHSS